MVLVRWFPDIRIGCFELMKLLLLSLSAGLIGKFTGVTGLALLEFCVLEESKSLGSESEKLTLFFGFLLFSRKQLGEELRIDFGLIPLIELCELLKLISCKGCPFPPPLAGDSGISGVLV